MSTGWRPSPAGRRALASKRTTTDDVAFLIPNEIERDEKVIAADARAVKRVAHDLGNDQIRSLDRCGQRPVWFAPPELPKGNSVGRESDRPLDFPNTGNEAVGLDGLDDRAAITNNVNGVRRQVAPDHLFITSFQGKIQAW